MHLAEDLYPHTSATWVFPNNGGYLLGVPIIRIIVYWVYIGISLSGETTTYVPKFFVSKLMKMHAHPRRGNRPRGRQVIKLTVVKITHRSTF